MRDHQCLLPCKRISQVSAVALGSLLAGGSGPCLSRHLCLWKGELSQSITSEQQLYSDIAFLTDT